METVDLIAEARKVVGPGPDVKETLANTPRAVPSNVRMLGIVGIVIGVLALAMGVMTSPERTGGAFLTCIVYFFGISMGGVMFTVIQTITLGRWGRPFKRIGEAFGMFLPVVWVLYTIFLLFGTSIYPWTHDDHLAPHKAIWLTQPFFQARQIVSMGFLSLLALIFVRNSLRPDLGTAAEVVGSRAPAWWASLTSGWQGRAAEVEAAYQKNIRLAPVIVVCYMLIFSMFAVDAVMSLSHHWYANMFPAWMAVSSVWLALNWVVIVSVFARKWLNIEHLIKPSNYHDIGKLVFALCIFWTYNLFAQILPIWYGNMPEETGYLMLRIFAEPWAPLAKVVFAMCFLMPFTVLLSRGIKKIPSAFAAISTVIVIGVFLERFILVMPQVWHENSLPIGLVEIGLFLGFLGAFITVVTTFLSKVPPVVFTDPFMNPNPADVHVHPHHHGEHGNGHAHA